MDALGVSRRTLYNYVEKGLIRVTKYQMPRLMGKNNYNDSDVLALLGQGLRSKDREIVAYVRARGKTKEDDASILDQRQGIQQFLRARGATVDEIFEDRSSSMTTNFGKRPGLDLLIQKVLRGEVDALVMDTRCRLIRWGWDVYEAMFRYHGVKVIIMNKVMGNPYYESEQSDDLAMVLAEAKIDRIGK